MAINRLGCATLPFFFSLGGLMRWIPCAQVLALEILTNASSTSSVKIAPIPKNSITKEKGKRKCVYLHIVSLLPNRLGTSMWEKTLARSDRKII